MEPRLAERSLVNEVSVAFDQMDSGVVGAWIAGMDPGWLLQMQVEFRPIRLAW